MWIVSWGGVRDRILSVICLQPLGGSTPAHETDLDIPITYSGLRPGEKLWEEIFYDAEAVRATSADGVWVASDPAEPVLRL